MGCAQSTKVKQQQGDSRREVTIYRCVATNLEFDSYEAVQLHANETGNSTYLEITRPAEKVSTPAGLTVGGNEVSPPGFGPNDFPRDLASVTKEWLSFVLKTKVSSFESKVLDMVCDTFQLPCPVC